MYIMKFNTNINFYIKQNEMDHIMCHIIASIKHNRPYICYQAKTFNNLHHLNLGENGSIHTI